IDDVKLNGKLTLGENTADNGGLRIALMAYLARTANQPAQALDGFTPEQRGFLGWGQVWCENVRPQRARMLAQIDPHSRRDDPALARRRSRERRRVEHAGIPEGLLVQGRRADGAEESVSRVVTTKSGRASRSGRTGRAVPVVSGFSRTLADVHADIVTCERCPRLRRYCAEVA